MCSYIKPTEIKWQGFEIRLPSVNTDGMFLIFNYMIENFIFISEITPRETDISALKIKGCSFKRISFKFLKLL